MTPALAVVRSLGRLGLDVDVASPVPEGIATYSRHCRTALVYPDPLTREAAFLAWCADQLARNAYRLIIPVTERTVVPMQTLLDRPGGERITIAPPEALALALDKDRTLALAAQLCIPAPRSEQVTDMAELDQASQALSLPLVLKPARSIGADGGERRQLSVAYAFSPRELHDKAEHFLRYGPLLLQEYVGGVGVGIELIADRGEVVFAFQHQRLHEVPLTGGGSSLRKSVSVEPELLDASRKLIAALKWHGVAMVEFKWIPAERRLSLMEINGRFWGSLPLAIASGADFPAMLYELYTQGKVNPRPPARQDVYCRKLSSDLYWHEMVLRRDGPPELVTFPSKGSMLRDALRVFSPRHYFDVQQWRDPKPGLVDLTRIWREQADRLKRLLEERRARKDHRHIWQSGEVSRRLANAQHILFICYGNINRSALAERYFYSLPASQHVEALSAGFHDTEGRPADPVMVEVAAASGIDLSDWSSRKVTREMIDASDVVLVMEYRHIQKIATLFPDAIERTFLLGMASDSQGGDAIADPYGKPRPLYERCSSQVRSAVDAIAGLLRDAHG